MPFEQADSRPTLAIGPPNETDELVEEAHEDDELLVMVVDVDAPSPNGSDGWLEAERPNRELNTLLLCSCC